MKYAASGLENVLLNALKAEPKLMLGEGGLTKALKHVAKCISGGISESHNSWQGTCKINNIIVNGGTCAVSGPLSSGIGLGPPGTISKTISGTGKKIAGKLEFEKITLSQKDFVLSVGKGFETVQNSFLLSVTISNVSVNGGTCSCKIVSGAPVPGGYSGGSGKLAVLEGNLKGDLPTAAKFKKAITDDIKSSLLKGEKMTLALKANINAVSIALFNYHSKWMSSTKIESLMVSGGISIPNAPIIMATGKNGIFS